MSTKILLQTILKLRDQIKTGAANFMDVSAEYFKSTGDFMDDSQKAIALEEINKIAPSNVTTLEGVDPRETIMPMGGRPKSTGTKGEDVDIEEMNWKDLVDDKVTTVDQKPFDYDNFVARVEASYRKTVADELKKLQEASPAEKSKMIKEIINRQGVYKNLDQADISMLLRSVDDTQLQDFLKVQAQKPTTLKPKRYLGYTEEGRPIESPVYFDDMGANEKSIDFSRYKNKRDREEYAEFVRKMRGEGISNKQIKEIARTTGDISEGKRAATSIARANDMDADTKLKQEVLSELDEMKADRGPRYFQGDEFGGGPMGYDSYGEFLDAEASKIINSIEEDLIAKGMPEEKAEELLSSVRELRRDSTSPLRNDLKGLVNKISDEIGDAVDNDEIDFFYSTRFWDKYVDEILKLTQKPEPRFEYGGLV